VVVGEWKKATKAVATLEEARKLIEVIGGELDSANREIAQLRHRVDQLCRTVFGRRSEKGVVVEQGVLPFGKRVTNTVPATARGLSERRSTALATRLGPRVAAADLSRSAA